MTMMKMKMANTTKDYAYKLGLGITGVVLGVALIGGLVALLFGVEALLSFEVAFLGFVSIVGGSFAGVLKRVKAQEQDSISLASRQDLDMQQSLTQDSQLAEETKESHNQAKQENSSFSTRFVLGTQMSFSLLRMLGYIIFTGLILFLLHYRLFSILWFFVGLCVALVVLVGLGMFAVKAYKYTKM